MLKIWYIQSDYPYANFPLQRGEALEKIWSGHSFEILAPDDMRRISGERADITFVVSHLALRVLVRSRIDSSKMGLKVFIPRWGRSSKWEKMEFEAAKSGHFHLVLPDQTTRLFHKAHKNVFTVNLGFDPVIFYPDPKSPKVRGVAFFGSFTKKRRGPLLQALAEHFPEELYMERGNQAEGPLSPTEVAAELRQAKIGWNQSYALGGMNTRVLETMASGALLLTNRTVDIRMNFREGKHLVFWYNEKDLIKKVRYFLDHDKEREQIAERGCREAHANHTWEARAREYRDIVEAFY